MRISDWSSDVCSSYLVRSLYDANRRMPSEGHTTFGALKKKYAKGRELHGRTLGILGFGRIGREVAKVAFGMGMDVIAYDLFEFKTGRASWRERVCKYV